MKRFNWLWIGAFFIVCIAIGGCTIKDYSKEELAISVPHVIYFGNFVEVIIDPGQEKCRIIHEHFNRKHGHAFKVPYSIATVCIADKKFTISDKNVGNWAIEIDKKEYSVRKSNPVINAADGLRWTSGNFKQGPAQSIHNVITPWLYPLKGNVPQSKKNNTSYISQ